MNTALREATLITTAFMEAIAPNSNVDVTSSVNDIKALIQTALGSSISSITFNSTTYVLTSNATDGTSASVDLSVIKNQTSARATADGSGNNIVNTYATKAELNQAISGVDGAKLYIHENVVFRFGSGASDKKVISFITWKDETGLYDSSDPQPTYITWSEFLDWRPFDIYISDSWDGGFSATQSYPAFIIPKWENIGTQVTYTGLAYMPITSQSESGTATLQTLMINMYNAGGYPKLEYNTQGDSPVTPYKDNFSMTRRLLR